MCGIWASWTNNHVRDLQPFCKYLTNFGLAFKYSELTVAGRGILVMCLPGLASNLHSVSNFWGTLPPVATIQFSVFDSVSMRSALPTPSVRPLMLSEAVLKLIGCAFNH